ncbi:hypothetical protein FRP1_29825 (plasmid) [Pseudonocardia sp. EC080625-04]|nr:hypothetical protein FRP1_29825 [Pseudonocardia sp. EC080625-04]
MHEVTAPHQGSGVTARIFATQIERQLPSDRDTISIDGVELPDPLKTDAGNVVGSTAAWERERRPELLKAFQENVYGTTLPAPTRTT